MTTPRSVLAIVNPKTGRRPVDHFVDPLRSEASERGIDLRVVTTTEAGQAISLASDASDVADTIVAVGGDGTVSDVVAGSLGRPVTIAILPCGSTNMIAKELGIPKDPAEAARVALGDGETKSIDVAVTGDRAIVHMAGAGFDAAMMRDTSSRWKQRVRWLAYLPAGARNLNYPRFEFSGSIDGEPIGGTARMILIAIGGSIIHPRLQVGSGIDRTDRVIDVLVFDPPRIADISTSLFWIAAGKPERSRWTTHYRGQHVNLSSPGDVPFEVDGDYAGELPIEVTLYDEPIRVRVPATAR